MTRRHYSAALVLALVAGLAGMAFVEAESGGGRRSEGLAVLWTCNDPVVARDVCFQYALSAKMDAWFDEVKLIVSGPSLRLLAEDATVQASVAALQKAGVLVVAGEVCAENYGLVDSLQALGVAVETIGPTLTHYLKNDYKVLQF